ncbi:MAG: hypothetical protein JSS83_08670 [Cyanobacteria bacterium SZAS LIN-3]|nr:hypothetical protein [Cyanobacteria bacterium SZAS LIN-3]
MNDKYTESNEEVYVGHLFKKKDVSKEASVESSASIADGVEHADHQELQSIVNHLVKLPEEAPESEVKPVKIARITHHEIAAMRVTQSGMPAMKVETKPKGQALIQTFDAILGLFKHADKRSRCLIDGHECKHCGQIIKAQSDAVEAPRGH